MIRRPPRSTLDRSSAASDVYKRQDQVRDDDHVGSLIDLNASARREDGVLDQNRHVLCGRIAEGSIERPQLAGEGALVFDFPAGGLFFSENGQRSDPDNGTLLDVAESVAAGDEVERFV